MLKVLYNFINYLSKIVWVYNKKYLEKLYLGSQN